MRWVVLKFGGTSVSTAARWSTVADLVRTGLQDPEAETRYEAAWLADLDELVEVRDDLVAALQTERDGRARGQMQKTLERLHPLEVGDPDRGLLD